MYFQWPFLLVLGLTAVLLGAVSGCDSKQSNTALKTNSEDPAVNVVKGQELYLSYGCAVCHGKNGDGNGINAKRYYPPPTDLREPSDYRHGSTKEDVIKTIKYGVREENSGMPAFDHITEEELNQLSDFLLSLRQKK